MTVPLSSLIPGESGIVEKVESPIALRLFELGLTEGLTVECMLVSPFSDPSAFNIRGAVIAIRNKDCKDILVKRV